MTRLTTLDLPSIHRHFVGFDSMFDEMETMFENSKSQGYPPYNIVQINENEYMISLAVAGFGMDNLSVEKDNKILKIEGKTPIGSDNEDIKYLHKGIGTRNFRREFTLAEHVDVVSAGLDLGVLNVHLKREVPEELQPKQIKITDHSNTVIEGKVEGK